METKAFKMQGETDVSVRVGDSQTPFSRVNRTSRQKSSDNVDGLSN